MILSRLIGMRIDPFATAVKSAQRRPQESIWEAQGIDLAGMPWRLCTGL
jgi:hypothetical protein